MKKHELILDKVTYKLYKSSSLKFISNLKLLKNEFLSINYADGIYSVYMPSHYPITGIDASAPNWCRFKINTVIDFELYGILNDVLQSFTDSKISVLVISGFDTDYIFIDQTKLSLLLEYASEKLTIISGSVDPKDGDDITEIFKDEHCNCSSFNASKLSM